MRACVLRREERGKREIEREWESENGARAKETYNEILLQAGIYTHAHLSTKNIKKEKKKNRIYTRITQI